jgi:hypothetical protein
MFPWLRNSRRSGVFSALCRVTLWTLLQSAEVNMFPLLGDRGKRLDCARVGRGHVTFAVLQWRQATVEALLEAVFFHVFNRGFIAETEVRLQRVLGGRSVVEDDLNVWIEDLYEQLSVEWERKIAGVRILQFKLVLGVSCEECFCEEKFYV